MTVRMKWAVLLLVAACAAAAAQEQRGPSTPEERQRFVEIAHKLEASPLDAGLKPDVRWALKWIIEVPDVDVSLCTAPLNGLLGSKYKYEAELFGEYTLALGAFVIEHPEKAKDDNAVNLAGTQSVLRAYQAILKQEPKRTSKQLDELLQKQAKGELGGFVQKATKEQCKGSRGTS